MLLRKVVERISLREGDVIHKLGLRGSRIKNVKKWGKWIEFEVEE